MINSVGALLFLLLGYMIIWVMVTEDKRTAHKYNKDKEPTYYKNIYKKDKYL